MNIDILRQIDKHFGPPVCRFLLFLKFFADFFSPPRGETDLPENIKKILILKFWGMGSILLASPPISELKKKYPSAEIALLTLSENAQICDILPSIDKCIYLAIGNLPRFALDLFRTILDIRRENYDVVIDLEFVTGFSAFTTLIITLFAGRKVSIGFNSPVKWRNSVYSINVSFDHSRHICKIFAKVFAVLNEQEKDFEISFEKEKTELLKLAETEFLRELIQPGNSSERRQRLVCVNINSGALSLLRRWPREHFAALVRELIEKSDVNIALIGGKSDRGYVDEFVRMLPASPRIINFCGKLSIKQLIGLFSKSDLLITNDSGPLHIACVVGTPTVSFFGPETPFLYGPVGDNHHVFYEDLYCSPCLNIYNSKITHCNDNVCLKDVRPETVLKLIEEKYGLFAKVADNRGRAAIF